MACLQVSLNDTCGFHNSLFCAFELSKYLWRQAMAIVPQSILEARPKIL